MVNTFPSGQHLGGIKPLSPQVFTQHGAQFGIVIHQQDLHMRSPLSAAIFAACHALGSHFYETLTLGAKSLNPALG